MYEIWWKFVNLINIWNNSASWDLRRVSSSLECEHWTWVDLGFLIKKGHLLAKFRVQQREGGAQPRSPLPPGTPRETKVRLPIYHMTLPCFFETLNMNEKELSNLGVTLCWNRSCPSGNVFSVPQRKFLFYWRHQNVKYMLTHQQKIGINISSHK